MSLRTAMQKKYPFRVWVEDPSRAALTDEQLWTSCENIHMLFETLGGNNTFPPETLYAVALDALVPVLPLWESWAQTYAPAQTALPREIVCKMGTEDEIPYEMCRPLNKILYPPGWKSPGLPEKPLTPEHIARVTAEFVLRAVCEMVIVRPENTSVRAKNVQRSFYAVSALKSVDYALCLNAREERLRHDDDDICFPVIPHLPADFLRDRVPFAQVQEHFSNCA